MLAALVITLREGLEAALLIAIIQSCVLRSGRERLMGVVWTGVLAAAFVSLLAAVFFYGFVGGYGGDTEELVEAVTMLLAVGVLTYVIIWVHNQARGLAGEVREKVQSVMEGESALPLGILAFFIVVREGIEIVLFTYAAFLGSSAAATATGAFLGMSIAAILGLIIYRGSRKLPIQAFFKVTGVLLIFFGAGLLASAVKIFQELGYLSFLTTMLWNTESLISADGVLGVILGTLAGYDPAPTTLQLVVWVLYTFSIGAIYFLAQSAAPSSRAAAIPGKIPAKAAEGGRGTRSGGRNQVDAAVPGGEIPGKKRNAIKSVIVAGTGLLLVSFAWLGFAGGGEPSAPGMASAEPEVVHQITARQFRFEPAELKAAPGQRVRVIVKSIDVAHGFAFPGGAVLVPPGREKTIDFTAPSRAGRSVFHCMVPCGSSHDGMKWELVVE
ncbi:MAG: FTR1 family protein [Firmicutes bacterium]|nr:FTR1 family protein [Bacillota bacterium]